MRMKKLMGRLIATVMAMGMVGGMSANAERILITETTADANVVEMTAESSVIWRASHEYTITDEYARKNVYQYTMTAETNGHIHIDLYCLQGGTCHADVIGKIAYNDSMISSINDNGSTFNSHGYSKNVVSYDGDNIVYTTIYGGGGNSGNLYATYDFYVKEPYLTTEQTLYIWNDTFTIPYGKPMVDYQSQIADLAVENEMLKSQNDNLIVENETLKDENNRLLTTLSTQGNRAYGDMNDDGYVDARDASLLLTLYARQSVGDPITLDQLVEEQKGQ